MRKFFIRGSILLAILLVIDKPVGWSISQLAMKRQYDDRMGKLGRGDIKSELLIIGSSRALNDIDAGQLEQLSGKKTYGLGFSGSNHAFHLSVLRIALKSGNPQAVVLTIDQGTSFIPNQKSIYRKDLLFPFSAYAPVFQELVTFSEKVFWLGQACWMYRENNNLITALTYLKSGKLPPDMTSDIDAHGSVLLKGRSADFDAFSPGATDQKYTRENESAVLTGSLEAILDLCRKHGIALFLVQPPHLFKSYKGFNQRLEEVVAGRATILDMSDMTLRETDFFDAGHLNSKGAGRFTKELYLRMKHGL